MTIEERFTTPKNYATEQEASKARNARAKALRAEGYTVKCQKWDFSDLARGASFTLTAHKP